MNRVRHFEIPVDDPERAMEFYSKTFGWEFTPWSGPEPYWLIQTGEGEPGIDGGLMKKKHPDQPVVNTVAVESIDQSLKDVADNGGQCVVPKTVVPGVGWLAYCKDPEGIIFGMMQIDASAA